VNNPFVDGNKSDGFATRLFEKMINNVQLVVEDIHIRYSAAFTVVMSHRLIIIWRF